MNKTLKTIITVSTAAFLFASCHDNIYESINAEVKLESNGINGTGTISRYGDYLIFPTGHLYYKTNQSSNDTGLYNKQWAKAGLPETEKADYIDGQCYYAVGDQSNLYIMIHSWYENSSGYNAVSGRQLFVTTDTDFSDGIEWTEITIDDNLTPVKLFSNNAYDAANRLAYLRAYDSDDSTYKIYSLSGTSSPVEVTDESTGLSSDTLTAVYFPKDGQTYFSKYYSLTANDDYIYYSLTYNNSGSMATGSSIYRADGYGTYYTYSTASTSSDSNPSEEGWYEYDSDSDTYTLSSDTSLDSSKTYYTAKENTGFTLDSAAASATSCDAGGIISMAVTSNYLLLGTTSGLNRVLLSSTGDSTSLDNIPYTSTTSFSNNGNSIITEYAYSVFTLEPSDAEGENDEYVSSVIYGSVSSSSDNWEDTGLYSYYKGRGTWNRDGTDDNSSSGN
ncbi:hypothetical protein [Treponema sp.]|uniref:hypothetical protein n=1 Tax=Treponema sp. TaxID=166 RepID=UPI0025F23B1A|nr:hypothetical protein [Treponema sp.]MCR5218057.1 hypothetical protein [Treponema sp.]